MDRNKNWGTSKYWKREITFELYAPEEERVEGNENFYNKSKEILNKTNKNSCILLSEDL